MKKTIIREYNLSHRDKGMTGEVTIAFLTDIHNCLSPKEQEDIFLMLSKVKPDIVLIGGDVLVGKVGKTVELAADFIKGLSEKYVVIYANGNHEQRVRLYTEEYGDMGEVYEKLIAKTKVIRSINQEIQLNIHDIPFSIYGLEADMCFYKRGRKEKGMFEELERLLGEKREERYCILLAHNPRYAKEYFAWKPELILSGHYHGGMMLLGKRRGVISPDYRLLNRDCCGLQTCGTSNMIVSAGLGEHTIPFRIHNPRELTVVRIHFSGKDK